MKTTRWQTTNNDFLVFKRECLRLQKAWKLIWPTKLLIRHKKLDCDKALAAVRVYEERGVVWPPRAEVKLARSWGSKPTRKRLIETARHEMIHVLLLPLSSFARETRVRNRTKWSDSQEHLLLMGLWPILFPGEETTWQLE